MKADVHRAEKARRERREQRYYKHAALGALCSGGCGTKVPKALNEAGIWSHPTCGPSELLLIVNRGRRHLVDQ